MHDFWKLSTAPRQPNPKKAHHSTHFLRAQRKYCVSFFDAELSLLPTIIHHCLHGHIEQVFSIRLFPLLVLLVGIIMYCHSTQLILLQAVSCSSWPFCSHIPRLLDAGFLLYIFLSLPSSFPTCLPDPELFNSYILVIWRAQFFLKFYAQHSNSSIHVKHPYFHPSC